MAHALVRGDARMLDDPLRAQAVAYGIGCVAAAVAIAAGAVLALVGRGVAPGDAPILMARDSGALYVRIDDSVHPVLNLASARLVVGRPANPVVVSDAAIGRLPRGPLVGIPGAPAAMGRPLGLDETEWTICDGTEPAETLLLTGRGAAALTPLAGGQAVLVSARDAGAPAYLLADGRRARVDLRDIAVVRALHLEGMVAQPVSQALLNSVPEAPAVAAPTISGAGGPGPAALGRLTVGTVVRVVGTGPAELYVVLAEGLQRVNRVAADLIRFTVPQPEGEPPVLPADMVADVAVAHTLTGTFPDRVLARTRPVVCTRWDPHGAGRTNIAVAMADSLPGGGVRLAQADAAGPGIDRVQVPTGRSVLLQAGGVTRDAAALPGPLYLLNDLGVVFGIPDRATADALGLTGAAVAAPWPMVSMLPRGPELDRAAASVVRDALSGLPAAPA